MVKDYYFGNETRIFYKKNEFKKGRKTLVFVHGLSSNSSAWFKFEKKFEKKYNILLIDLRGHGKSSKPKNYEDYAISNFSEDLYNVINHEKIKKFVLICHSFAVFIGLEFLKKHQSLVSSVVLLSPAYKPPLDGIAKVVRFLLKSKNLLENIPSIKSYGNHFDYAPYEGTGDWNIRRLLKDIRNTSLRVYLYATRHSYTFNAKKSLSKIKVPVLLVQGKQDRVFYHENYKQMKKMIKNSKLVLLDNASHVLVLNDFSRVSKLIEDFIKSKNGGIKC